MMSEARSSNWTPSRREKLQQTMTEYETLIQEQQRRQAQQSALAWTTLHGLKTEKGEPLDFGQHAYLKEPYELNHPRVVIRKAAQVGVTTLCCLKALWFADTRAASVIFTMPTVSDVSSFSQSRLDAMIQRVPYLAERMRGVNNVTMKQLGHEADGEFVASSIIHLGGTFVERGKAISVPADFVIHDELDRSRPDTLEIYEDRLDHSDYKWRWMVSTPTAPGFGIDALWQQSDQREWRVLCPACGKHTLVDYHEGRRGEGPDMHYVCLRCGARLDDRTKGQWVAAYPGRELVGYHISQTSVPWMSAHDLWRKEQSVERQSTFRNFNLGEPYAEGVGLLTRELFLQRCFREPYERAPAGEGCLMGVDQGDWIYVEVRIREEDGSFRVIHIEKTKDWDRLSQLMHQFDVDCCVIDAQPETRLARQLRDEFPERVLLCYYTAQELPVEFSHKERGAVRADRTQTLDDAANDVVEGRLRLFRWDEDVAEYVAHHCNTVRVERENDHGEVTYSWEKTGPDHYRHADNYARIAAQICPEGSRTKLSPEDQALIDYYGPQMEAADKAAMEAYEKHEARMMARHEALQERQLARFRLRKLERVDEERAREGWF